MRGSKEGTIPNPSTLRKKKSTKSKIQNHINLNKPPKKGKAMRKKMAQYASQNAICFIQATRKSLLPRIIVTLISASYFGALKTVFMHSHAICTRVHF